MFARFAPPGPARPCRLAALVGWLLVLQLPPLAAAQWLPSAGYEIARMGLFGDGYEYTDGEGLHHSSSVEFSSLNALGQVAGISARYSPSGADLGADAWFYDGASTHVLGLNGGVYQFENDDGVYRRSDFEALNNAGQVTGTSLRYSGPEDAFGSLGRDAWFYDGQNTTQIGLVGGVYERTLEGGIHRFSTAFLLNDAGHAAGLSNRFNNMGHSLGADAWLFDGSITHLISRTGTGYEAAVTLPDGGMHRYSRPHGINSAGQMAGVSTRFDSLGMNQLGVEAWLYDGLDWHTLGLVGSEYEVEVDGELASLSEPRLINEMGHVTGDTLRVNSVGEPQLGSLGRDAWLYDGNTTHRVGLFGDEYGLPDANGEVTRVSIITALNNSGQAAGSTQRFAGTLNDFLLLGNDTWITDGTTTQLAGLTGSGYEYETGRGIFRTSGIVSLGLNDAGQLAGVTARFNEEGLEQGQAGWFYDSQTGETTPLEFSIRQSDGYSFTEPHLLTPEGVVLGTYELFDGNASLGNRLFWWSLQDGLHDLGDLVSGGLSAAGWQLLTSVVRSAGSANGAAPRFIIGSGSIDGQAVPQNPFDTEGESVYLLSAIPGDDLPGDYNADGVVSAADYVVWRNHNGQNVTLPGDPTPGSVTQADYDVWVANFGKSASGTGAASSAVPEPASVVMFLLAALTVVAGNRRPATPR